MGAVGGMLGMGGGAGGSGFATPAQARIDDAASIQQATDLYNQNQAQLTSQQGFINQMMPSGTAGLQGQQQAMQGFQDIYAGRGPDLAGAQLQQATQQNIANQAALMGGQRGSSQNTGLLARQASMQGANIQQQAAGQGATLKAQQQMGALSGIGNIANQQIGQVTGAQQAYTGALQGEQQNVLNSIAQANSARASVQSSINQSNASMANTRMGQQGSMFGNIMGGAGSALSSFFSQGGSVAGPTKPIMLYGGGDYAPVDTSNNFDTAQAAQSTAGQVPTAAPPDPGAPKGPKSKIGQFFKNLSNPQSPSPTAANDPNASLGQGANQLGQAIGKGIGNLFSSSKSDSTPSQDYYGNIGGDTPIQTASEYESDRLKAQDPSVNLIGPQPETSGQTTIDTSGDIPTAARGGRVPAMVSPGEVYLNRKAVKEVEKGKDPIKAGDKIPGKAKVKGDSLKNDTVSKTLESGGIVLPKSVMESKHPHWEAHKFVSAIMAKQGKLPAKKSK